ncbi:hypothetical protein Q5H92_00125 [Hymenobacter sp. M29]|uniref:Uncharacterized protein n=1 Tax=Hymenobacter mellowenesis TaxID=3063995 RepID=A0ABT9A5V2_9BACT|nr:hypothetical protein [Hymenobacter sp. M29]MDO7844744.1 hypothetical protein [Hymenobacter sp. M29]
MLLSRLFGSGSPTRPVDLDGLATLELPASFHLDDTPDQHLPPARRRRRQPYLRPLVSADHLTYYLPSHDSQGLGGREVPVLLRVTLYADDVPLTEAPDPAYFHAIAQQHYHYDGQREATYARAAPAGAGLYFTEEARTAPGWFSVKSFHEMHMILTDPAQHTRLFLSVDDREMSRAAAEKLLRQTMRSLQREPVTLAQHFTYLRHFLQHEAALKAANVQANLLHFSQELAGANLPGLRPVALYEPGRFVDVGDYFYGVNEFQEVLFVAQLGTSTQPQPATPAYFTANNSAGRYLASFNQQAILQQGVPAGHELRRRTGVSEPLWFPPEEFSTFQLAGLLRETQESRTQAQRQPGFAAAPHHAPVYWDLSRAENTQNPATLSQPADYRHAGLQYGAVTETHFTLHYVGIRTATGQPPQLVFTLEIFDSSPRYRTVAADAQYLAVDAAQGGVAAFAVAGRRYRARIEPVRQGQLTVEAE